MKNKEINNIYLVAGIVVILLLGFLIGMNSQEKEINVYNDETGVNTLSVSSTITKEIAPDETEISLAIETLSDTALTSQEDNKKLSNAVMNDLKLTGLTEEQIETNNYFIREEKQWNKESEKYETIGYKTINNMKITLNDLSKVGKIIDVAVEAGANKVNGINFTLSEETQKREKENALFEAGQYARTKGDKIANGLGVTIKGIHSISESSYNYTPSYYSYDMSATKGVEESTPISPEDVSMSTTITVQFEV
jgi:uncharacterized protein